MVPCSACVVHGSRKFVSTETVLIQVVLDSLRHVLFVTPVECSLEKQSTSFCHFWSKRETKSLQLLAALTETLSVGMQANGYIMQVAVILSLSCLGEDSEG